MKTLVLTALLFAFCTVAYAQQPSHDELMSPDPVMREAMADGNLYFEALGKYARNDDCYTRLVERFERNDETLSDSDILVLYYGYAYRDEYVGSEIGEWDRLIARKRYDKAYSSLCDALKRAPATPNFLEKAVGLAERLGRPQEEVSSFSWRLARLLACIHMSADGTADSPWVVLSVADEYTVMRCLLGVRQTKGQSFTTNGQGTRCDVIRIEPVDNSYFKGSEIWFDVSFPFIMFGSPGHWAKTLSGAEAGLQEPSITE